VRAARQEGVDVPRDLAVVGFDDIPFASYVSPSLTTVAQPKREMGQLAMEMVLFLMENGPREDGSVSNIHVKGQLIVRESSGARSLKPGGVGRTQVQTDLEA
jgi:DNA-binding LacI/PurR family transcriptional regulator